MNWVVPSLVVLNILVGFLGFFLGRKAQARLSHELWVERYNKVKELEKRSHALLEDKLRQLEKDKILFEQATWQEKLEILNGKKK